VTGGAGTDVCRLRRIQTQFRHATLKQLKLLIGYALLTALQKNLERVIALVSEKVPALAKGLPEPPVGTRYTVFVARKPWAKVAEALAADAEDAAIIEGYAALDPRVEGIAGYATSATTKRLQAAKRATQPATTP